MLVVSLIPKCEGLGAPAEKDSFSRAQLNALIDLAEAGLKEIFAAQRAVLGV
jgi:ribonuclease PH